MSISLIIANLLTLLAFLFHTFQGDKEIRLIEPDTASDEKFIKQEKWTMARCGWHWISFDLLFAGIGMGLINFTEYFEAEKMLLDILTVYFFGYALVWLFAILISKKFSSNYFKLGQWILLLLIGSLLYYGNS